MPRELPGQTEQQSSGGAGLQAGGGLRRCLPCYIELASWLPFGPTPQSCQGPTHAGLPLFLCVCVLVLGLCLSSLSASLIFADPCLCTDRHRGSLSPIGYSVVPAFFVEKIFLFTLSCHDTLLKNRLHVSLHFISGSFILNYLPFNTPIQHFVDYCRFIVKTESHIV